MFAGVIVLDNNACWCVSEIFWCFESDAVECFSLTEVEVESDVNIIVFGIESVTAAVEQIGLFAVI